MACDIESRLRTTIKNEIKGNATSYKIEEKRIFIPFNPKSNYIKTLEQAIEVAKTKVLKINEKYKVWSKGDVVSLDNSQKDGAYVNIHPTQALIDTYEAEEQRKEVEEEDFQNWHSNNKSDIATEEEHREFWKKCVKK